MSKDYYAVLELDSNATEAEIKKSYKKLARKYHPDNSDTGDEEKFKFLQDAYSTISDPQKKSVYDQLGHEAYISGAHRAGSGQGFYGSGDVFSQFEDFFTTFFGGGGGGRPDPNRPQRGSDLQSVITVDFLDACFGAEQKITINKLSLCKSCDGTGAEAGHSPETCPTCQGAGQVKQQTQSILGTITHVADCPTCDGTGKIIKHKCKTCHGERFVQDTETLDVKIPAGIDNGMRMVLQGKGNDGLNGGQAGDYYLGIRVEEHEVFERDGADIIIQHDINVAEAILGHKVTIPTIHGDKEVDVKPGTQPNTVITLKNEGVHYANGRKGGQYIHLNLIIPNKKEISKDLTSQLEELLNSNKAKSNADKKKSKKEKDKSFFGF